MLPLSISKLPFWRLIKFAITGGSALLLDMGLYMLFTRVFGLPYITSRALSLSIAVIWNFTLNRQWTFQATSEKVRYQAPRFVLVLISTSILNLALMKFGITVLHLYDLLVIIVNSVLIMFINFYAHALWSYKKTGEV